MLDPREMVIPDEGDYPESTPEVYGNVIEGKSIGRGLNPVAALEHSAHASPHSLDDAENMVEELTLQNYGNANLAVVGCSSDRDRLQSRQNQWQHLYQPGGQSGSASSCRDTGNTWEDLGYSSLQAQLLCEKPTSIDINEVTELTTKTNSDSNGVLDNTLLPGGIRTKMISKSGFTEFFVKNTFKGKGVIYRCPASYGNGSKRWGNNDMRTDSVSLVAPDRSESSREKAVMPSPNFNAGSTVVPAHIPCNNGTSLREWLRARRHKVNKNEKLHIFRQIVELVHQSHSQRIVVQDLRPTYFKIWPSNKVEYIGLPPQIDMQSNVTDQDIRQFEIQETQKRILDSTSFTPINVKKYKFNQDLNLSGRWPQFPSRSGKSGCSNAIGINISEPQDSLVGYDIPNSEKSHQSRSSSPSVLNIAQQLKSGCSTAIAINISEPQDSLVGYDIPNSEKVHQSRSSSPPVLNIAQQQMTTVNNQLEEKWYAGHERGSCTLSANIYCLGVLFFELLGSFDSEKAHIAAMLDLRHRILPPRFLAENPREAGFCLWLLHPEPSLRPTTRDILQSEVISGLQEPCGEDLSLSIEIEDVEAELLLHFLAISREKEEKRSLKLAEEIRVLEADIEEVQRRQLFKRSLGHSFLRDSLRAREEILQKEIYKSDVLSPSFHASCTSDSRSVKNISQLENAYFSMRSNIPASPADATVRSGRDLLNNRENWHALQEVEGADEQPDSVGAFFDGLCKYARYSKFEVRGILRNGDLNSANVICSLSFDRDEDYFAAAGVSKKIKVYEYQPLFNESVDIHYPVIEMSNRSKLSSICWNAYIKNYLASTDYDGLVKLWDVSTGQPFSEYSEHQKRAWSVDFSRLDPTKFASGSDDCLVKLWSINQRNCLGTIRNIANVCCVQFSSHSSNLLAFGSADYKTYCYDLRKTNSPWCVLAGHQKAVSYVKFVDSETLVSASTDDTLKLWDLSKTSSNGLSTDACSLTLRGHTNEKNFVGLSVADGYIACGSETNEVYAYYKSLPMPISSHKFGSIDPISGKETDEENGHFVSCVCWRGKSDTVIAANSTGCIKVLQMV